MPTTLARGNLDEVYVPTNSSLTITPGSGGFVRVGFSVLQGMAPVPPRDVRSEATISVSGGTTLFLEAVGADATYTSPVSGDGLVLASGAGDAEFAAAAASAIAAGHNTVSLIPRGSYTSTRGWALSGVRLLGNGATITRAAQPYWTTSETLTSGSTTSILLDSAADPLDLRVGDQIMAIQGLRYSARGTVQSISQDRRTITLTAPLACGASSIAPGGAVITGPAESSWTLAGTTTIARVWWTLDAAGALLLNDVVIDGNAASVPYARWDTMAEVRAKRLDCIGAVEVKNFTGEGIMQTTSSPDDVRLWTQASTPWSQNGLIGPLHIHDGGGNGLHFSGSRDITLHPGSRFYTLNQSPECGHVGGAISFSWGGGRLNVAGAYFRDCYAAVGFGGVQAADAFVLQGCVIQDMHRYLVFSTANGTAYQSSRWSIAENLVRNGGQLLIASTAGFRRFASLNIHHNHMIGSAMRLTAVDGGAVDHNTVDQRLHVPTTTTADITAGFTVSVTVASITGYSVGDTVRFVKGATVSQPVVLTSAAAGALGWASAIAVSIASGADVVREDIRTVGIMSGTVTAGATSFTLRNAGLFKKNQWVILYNDAANTSTTQVRISDVNYATGVVTVDGTISRSYSSGNTLVVWGAEPDNDGCIYLSGGTKVNVDTNTLRGMVAGVWVASTADQGTKIRGNVIDEYRGYGVFGGDVSSSEEVSGNTIIAVAGRSASWGTGIFAQSRQLLLGNTLIIPASTHDNAIQITASATGVVADRNVLRVSGGNAGTGSAIRIAGASGNVVTNTLTNGTVVDVGTNTVAGTQAITL